jgi:hypothetical protein
VAPLLPMLALALGWTWHLRAARASSGFDVAATWATLPWQRLQPSSLVEGALGGLRGSIEGALLLLATAYLVAGLILAWRRGGHDKLLLAVASLFFSVYVLAPDKYLNTIAFNSRWLPSALALALLAVPVPWRPRLSTPLALTIFALFMALTAAAWRAVVVEELTGLEPALAAVPDNARVVGLDFVRVSQLIRGQPFFQLFAYAQVLHHGRLNFSFAEHGSSLVRDRAARNPPFTIGLEWKPQRFADDDLRFFDVALVQGNDRVHDALARHPGFTPVTTEGRWRLYRLHAPSP